MNKHVIEKTENLSGNTEVCEACACDINHDDTMWMIDGKPYCTECAAVYMAETLESAQFNGHTYEYRWYE